MPLQTAKEMIAAKEAVDQRCLASFGNDKTSLFRIEDAIRIEPSAIQVGVALRDRDSQKAERMPGVQGFTLLNAQLVLDFTKYNVAEKCENCFDPMKYMK